MLPLNFFDRSKDIFYVCTALLYELHCIYSVLFFWPLLSCLWGALHVMCISNSNDLSSHPIGVAWANFYSLPQLFDVLSNLLALEFRYFYFKTFLKSFVTLYAYSVWKSYFLRIKQFLWKILRNWISLNIGFDVY